MSVLTLSGKPVDWAKPPKPTARVLWSRLAANGKRVTGSLRTIAHLDHLNELALKKFGQPVVVIQPPYNTGVAASAGTHDFDAMTDVYIPGVGWREQEKFFRANGYFCWWRRPPAFGHHIHGGTLPPREGVDVSDDFREAGFKVGKYVDGGWSTAGRRYTSSQIEDYYKRRTGLSGHGPDDGWFPANIESTIFNLSAYIADQRHPVATPNRRKIYHDKNYAKGNSRVGDRTAAMKKLWADRDAQGGVKGKMWTTHWPHPRTEEFQTPDGKIPARGFRKLPARKVRSLRTRKGSYGIRNIRGALYDAKKAGVPGVEVDLKFAPTQAQMNRLARFARRAYGAQWKKHVEVKMAFTGPGANGAWRTSLSRAKKAGFTTTLIRYDGKPEDLPKYVDHFRRSPKQ